ncbi:aldehyde dehydrogenase family protein [Asaia prunellae]|uniref:aldehyde dehydrogenase family protein n=1 Tax=Asaia prunellae TaxID=610245 RepID=UPI00046F6EFE|nr:aldehyde dehydrogenase family protein [Asaia prunellae]
MTRGKETGHRSDEDGPSCIYPEECASHVLIDTLRQKQSIWEATPLSQRIRPLRRLRRALFLNTRSFVNLTPDHAPADVITSEIMPLLAAVRFLEREAGSLLKTVSLSSFGRPVWLWGVKSFVRRKALGTVLILAPDNYPLMLAAVQCLQALVAGNAVALKPAPGRTALLEHFVTLLMRAGFPDGIIRLVPEDAGPEATEAGFDLIMLTGSEETGKKVVQTAARTLTPTILELSGADPVFVLPSANIPLVANALHFGLTLNRGATCIAPRRVFVPRHRLDMLEARLSALLARNEGNIKPGQDRKLIDLIHTITRSGGRTRQVGPATLLVIEASQAHLVDIDLFAPWLALIAVDDTDEAVQLEDRARHALGASIFGDEKEARKLAQKLPAGTITINDLIVPSADPRLPFGGARASGYGVTRGREGLLALTRPVSVSMRRKGAFHLLTRVRFWHGR